MKKIIKKIPGHPRHHALFAILFAILSISTVIAIKSSVQASDLPTDGGTSVSGTPCSFDIGDWSECNSTGRQTRTVTKVPSGCIVTDSGVPSTTQNCTYTAIPVPIPCSYTYSTWSSCNASGFQTRSVTGKSPTGCVQTTNPILQQNCTYTAVNTTSAPIPCSYTYSTWSSCNASGFQTRSVTGKSPTGCVQTTNPILQQNCTYTAVNTTSAPIPCSYTYSTWSSCDTSGYQNRTVSAKTPSGCIDSTVPILKQSCTYATLTSNVVTCAYNLSDWGACNASSIQSRTIISKTPTGCYESEKPNLERQCEYIATSTSVSSIPESTSVNPPFNFLNLNGGEVVSGEIILQGTVSNASGVEFYLIPIESNSPKYLGQAIRKGSTIWEYSLDSKKQPNGSFSILAKVKNIYGIYDGGQRRLIILNSSPETQDATKDQEKEVVLKEGLKQAIPEISSDWQKQYFKQENCVDEKVCGGEADPDNDGLNNNEEHRLGTSPTNPDGDQDGFLDGDEIKNGFNPLKASPGDESDKMIFESPKETGEVKKEFYRVENVEMVSEESVGKKLKITGKALPNTYVTIYIYSDPIVLTVKTDSDGNWSYVLDKDIEDGEHEVYVAVTDNMGKITAKSEPIAFVKSAEAATIIPPAEASAGERAVSPTRSWSEKDFYFFLVIGLSALALVFSIIGLIKHELNKNPENTLPN